MAAAKRIRDFRRCPGPAFVVCGTPMNASRFAGPGPFLTWLVMGGLLSAVAGRAEGPSAGVLVLRDNGALRRFDIAADELEVRGRAPRSGRVTITPEPGLTSLHALARQRLAQGEETCLVLYEAGATRSPVTRRVLTRQVVVQLAPGVDPTVALAGLPEAAKPAALTCAPGFYLVTSRDPAGAPALAQVLRGRRGVVDVDVQLARHYELMLTPNDTYFSSQWHLLSAAGNDLKVTSVWDTYRGAGVTIGIVDSGVQATHPDLSPNYDSALSYDFVEDDADASPTDLTVEAHGTSVAGLAAARGNNSRGVAGVAYEAKLAAHRLIAGLAVSPLQIANAFSHRTDAIAIKNNSWGPPTYGTNLAYAGALLAGTLAHTAETGRAGRGTIHVFSAGNQGDVGDDVNYNSLKNSIYSVVVAATAQDGSAEPYSDAGAALVVAAPGGAASATQIVTTDLLGNDGYNYSGAVGDLSSRDYTRLFAGTSASAPLVSGVVALMLQANPDLGWRDVQEILLCSATKNAAADSGWATNSAGLKFHHRFGGGLANASNAVAWARTWVNLPPVIRQTVGVGALSLAIPDNDLFGVTVPLRFTNENLRAEHVLLRLDADHSRRGDLAVTLTSPGGMVSRLAAPRADLNSNYKGWTFMSRAHWGEKANGTWTLRVADAVPGEGGMLLAARLEVLGTYADPVRLETNACTEVAGRSNGNGSPDPGETLRETIWLHNNTAGSLTGLTATLGCDLPGVTLLTNESTYPVIPAGQSASNAVPFEYRLSKALCGTSIPFTLVTRVGADRITNTCSRLVGRAVDQPAVTNEFTSADVPQPVPDVTTIYSANAVPTVSGEVLDDVRVSIRIDHTAVGDMQIALQHPDGTEVILSDHEGGNDSDFGTGTCGPDAVLTVFDDAAATALVDGSAPFAGSYRPDEPLSALKDKPPGGVWRLRVSDTYDGDAGTLYCWSLQTVSHLRTTACDVFNLAPTADPLAIQVREGLSTNAVLTGADEDGDTLRFSTNAPPQHGTLTGFNRVTGEFVYAASLGYSGPDQFTFTTHDGFTNSEPAAVSITILPASTNASLALPALVPGTGFRIQVTAPPGLAYVLEATGDFGHWDPVLTNAPVSSPFWLTDPQAAQLPHRFYRLRR
jgi:subtilisin-like proprotein convertase family protein/subtilisin family serine protease